MDVKDRIQYPDHLGVFVCAGLTRVNEAVLCVGQRSGGCSQNWKEMLRHFRIVSASEAITEHFPSQAILSTLQKQLHPDHPVHTCYSQSLTVALPLQVFHGS